MLKKYRLSSLADKLDAKGEADSSLKPAKKAGKKSVKVEKVKGVKKPKRKK